MKLIEKKINWFIKGVITLFTHPLGHRRVTRATADQVRSPRQTSTPQIPSAFGPRGRPSDRAPQQRNAHPAAGTGVEELAAVGAIAQTHQRQPTPFTLAQEFVQHGITMPKSAVSVAPGASDDGKSAFPAARSATLFDDPNLDKNLGNVFLSTLEDWANALITQPLLPEHNKALLQWSNLLPVLQSLHAKDCGATAPDKGSLSLIDASIEAITIELLAAVHAKLDTPKQNSCFEKLVKALTQFTELSREFSKGVHLNSQALIDAHSEVNTALCDWIRTREKARLLAKAEARVSKVELLVNCAYDSKHAKNITDSVFNKLVCKTSDVKMDEMLRTSEQYTDKKLLARLRLADQNYQQKEGLIRRAAYLYRLERYEAAEQNVIAEIISTITTFRDNMRKALGEGYESLSTKEKKALDHSYTLLSQSSDDFLAILSNRNSQAGEAREANAEIFVDYVSNISSPCHTVTKTFTNDQQLAKSRLPLSTQQNMTFPMQHLTRHGLLTKQLTRIYVDALQEFEAGYPDWKDSDAMTHHHALLKERAHIYENITKQISKKVYEYNANTDSK